MCVIASKDESEEEIAGFVKALKGVKDVHWFKRSVHGFMSARADLGEELVRAEFERGYGLVLEWLGRWL